MTRPLRIQYPDAYYHVTCRGNERKDIFRDQEDQKEFFRLLARSVDIYEVKLLTYALMPNHFHFLVCTPKGNLSDFMRHFNISYTGAFNRKYERSGHLYQGRYKAFLIDADNYLLEVSRYIHLNPLRMKLKEPLKKRWQDLARNNWTSFPGYLNQKHRKAFVHYHTILDYFGGESPKSSNEYRKFVVYGMENEILSPLEKGKGTGIIGKEDFVDKIKKVFEKSRRDKKSTREQPALRELGKSILPDVLIDQYANLVQKNREELTRKGKQSTERAMLMEFLYRFCKITQPEIGKLLGGIDYSAVSLARKRVQLKIQNEPEWEKKFNQIGNMLSQM
jgi:putative transposase